MSTINRPALMRALTLVKPALAAQAYVPALTHVRFAGGWATAYNDVAAIMVRAGAPFERCVPGAMLLAALAGFKTDEVAVLGADGPVVTLKSGRSNVKLPTLDASALPFDLPTDDADCVDFDEAMLEGVRRCLMSVGTDSTRAALMGVTLDAGAGKAVLYSTDDFTLSRFETDTKVKLPGDAPVVMPTFFCEQLLALSKAFPKAVAAVFLLDGALLAEFQEPVDGKREVVANLFTRTPVDVAPLDFGGHFARHAGGKLAYAKVPDALDGALARALLVLGGELAKRVELDVRKEQLVVSADCAMGQSDDTMPMDADDLKDAVYSDAGLLARGLKACAVMAITPTVTVMQSHDEFFTHVIAHMPPPAKKKD